VVGWQHYFADKIQGRISELATFDKLVVRARTSSPSPVPIKVALLGKDGTSFAADLTLTSSFQEVAIPLSTLQLDSTILLPRPYPGFQPFWFTAGSARAFELQQAEKLQFRLGEKQPPTKPDQPYTLEVESVWLEKR
jgi:hypothetical protein